MWWRVADPHRQSAKAFSRDTAGDQLAHCQAAAGSKFIFEISQKADICFRLPFCIQCAGPPLTSQHWKWTLDF